MPPGHFRRREEVPEKPNHNSQVPGANEPRATENYLLRKKADVAGKPNTNMLVRGAEVAPTSARVKPKQEVTAKPNMLDLEAHQFQWKVIGGAGVDAGGAINETRFPEGPRHSAAAAPMPLPRGYNPAVHTNDADEVNRWSSPTNHKGLEPIPQPPPPPPQEAAPASSEPWLPAAAPPYLRQYASVQDQQVYAHPTNNAVGFALPLQQYNASAADLERIVFRNYEEAQKTFLRI